MTADGFPKSSKKRRGRAAPEDGTLVERGYIRVAREEAMRKLRDYQLPEEVSPLLFWIRCAVAAGATHIRIKQYAAWCEIRFDGRPFDRRDLSDPYGVLFGVRAPSGVMTKFLALGLLRAKRALPQQITVRSGTSPRRYILHWRPPEEDVLETSTDNETETAIQLAWKEPYSEFCRPLYLSAEGYMEHCIMSPASIALGDRLIFDPEEDGPPGTPIEAERLRGTVVAGEGPDGKAGYLDLCAYGVRVAQVRIPDLESPVRAWVNCDRFLMNASHTGVVRNARYTTAMSAVQSLARRLSAES
ncbi:MAG: hypothetical protein ABII00_12160 [Elusimicrobiota bacterium]